MTRTSRSSPRVLYQGCEFDDATTLTQKSAPGALSRIQAPRSGCA
jgi:hypothetical protein